jgi:hypothetical protein
MVVACSQPGTAPCGQVFSLQNLIYPRHISKVGKVDKVDSTHRFVLAQGFHQIAGIWGLLGHDGTLRLYGELTADPDHPRVRPIEAYRALLSSMQPGWTLRWLQIFWPDPHPREHFIKTVRNWSGFNESCDLLHQSLQIFLEEAALPYLRRTILEFQMPITKNGDGLDGGCRSWWAGLPSLLVPYGLVFMELSADEIQILAYQIMNPELE